jgi:hypothetical protein
MDRQPSEAMPADHNEYHSRLEFDDSTGWHIFIVPGLLLVLLIGAILSVVLMQ